MYAEAIREDQVIDCLKNPKYVKWQEKNKIFVISNQDEAEGVVSRDENLIYKLAGRDSRGDFTGDEVSIIAVDQQTYEADLDILQTENPYGVPKETVEKIRQDTVDNIVNAVNGGY